MATADPPLCPRCAAPMLPVIYGFPVPETIAQVEAGQAVAVLGGCMRRPEGTAWRCLRCTS